MNILIINDNHEIKGGSEIVMYGEIAELKKKGHSVFTFTFSDYIRKTGKDYIYKNSHFYPSRVFSRFVFNPKVYLSLNKFIKTIKPDVIHIHHNNQYSYSILLAIPKNTPTLYTAHDYGIVCASMWGVSKKNGAICNCKMGYGFKAITNFCISPIALPLFLVKKLLLSYVNKKIDCYIVPSMDLKKRLNINRFKHVEYIPNFIQLSKSNNNTKIKYSKYILYVGGVTTQKGLYYLIKSMVYVTQKYPNIKLLIVGQGKDKKSYVHLVMKLELEDKIIFLDKVDHREISSYYKNSLFVICPSIWEETFGLVIIEAMNYGKPVIGTRIGGIPEIIDDKVNGFLVEPRDEIQLAEKIMKLYSDKKLLNYMSKNAKLKSKQYSLNRYYDSIIKLYRKLIEVN